MSCQVCLQICPPSSPLLCSQAAILFSFCGLSHSLLAALPSIPASYLSQPPPPSIWTLVICKTENLSGSSLPTDDKMQADILYMTYMLTPAPFPRLISSNSPQHILLQLQKTTLQINHILSWLDVFAYAVSSPRNVLPLPLSCSQIQDFTKVLSEPLSEFRHSQLITI